MSSGLDSISKDVPVNFPSFLIGANYWASYAGTRMWSDWRKDAVDEDLKQLQSAGLNVLRVFPLWPDFQPLTILRGGNGLPREYRFGELPLPDNEFGQAGVSPETVTRFEKFLDMIAGHKMKCIVALINGWMSGRLFVPPAFDGMNVLTNPEAICWQVRFVRYFVSRFRSHPAIMAWEPGNECNCMGTISTRSEAYLWTAAITQAIRVADPDKPVLSGMHGLRINDGWTIQDQSELTDMLCVHPYPPFTPHCDHDPVNTIRTVLHGTAEARYYSDIGQKPCLCEEIGTLGPMIASENIVSDFVRNCLWSLWANDVSGFLWWCAYDQDRLEHAPYDWESVERELGMFRADRSSKPLLRELTAFGQMLKSLPFAALPPRRREAVCILSQDQDHWGVAYSSFILAKQAGFDIEFQGADQPLREAMLYLAPCLSGNRSISRRRMSALLKRVEAGATLYLSLDTALLSDFEAITGLRPLTRERRRPGESQIVMHELESRPEIPAGSQFRINFQATRASLLGTESDGNPAFVMVQYGRGQVFFLSVPIEMMLATTPGAFHSAKMEQAWRVYQRAGVHVMNGRVVRKQNPMLAVTEHPVGENERIIVLINHQPTPLSEELILADEWKMTTAHFGQVTAQQNKLKTSLPPNAGTIFTVKRH